jgi:hypothetical protein
MVIYVCNMCGYNTDRKSSYDNHLARKNPCQKVELDNYNKFSALNCTKKSAFCTKKSAKCAVEKKKDNIQLICNFCKKIFSRRFTLNRHLEICKIKLFKIKEEERKKIQKLIDINEQLLNSQEKLIKNQKNNEKKLDTLKKNVHNLKQNKIINNKIINNITLIAYNKRPDLSHLTNNDYLRIMNKGFKSIPKLIQAIHFNPEKPENQNVYIPNIKNSYAMVWNGDKWDLSNQEDLLDDMYDDNSNILIDKMEELVELNKKKNSKNILNKFKRFINEKDNNSVKNKIKEEIKLLLYNSKNKLNK